MRFRSALIAASALVLLGAACSSDEPDEAATEDSAPSTTETTETTEDSSDTTTTEAPTDEDDAEGFCGLLGDDDIDLDPTTDEGQATMDEIRGVAPAELQDSIEFIFDTFSEFEDLDEDDPDAFAEVMALTFDPEFLAAIGELETYGVDECGFEPGFMDDDAGDFDDMDDADPGTDDEEDPGSLDALQAWIDDNHADAAWADAVMSWGMFNGSVSLGGDLGADDALEACEAVADWMTSIDAVEDIEITDTAGEVLAEGSDGECVAA